MTIILKEKVNKKDFQEIIKSLVSKNKPKGVNTMKHCGVIKLEKEALLIQKEMRSEWE